MPQNFPNQPPTATPVPMDPKLPAYPPQFTPAPQAQFPPELVPVGPQGLGFGAPRAAFPIGTGIGLRPGMNQPQGVGTQLRLPPNQLRLQLQQRVQGPQQVRRQGGSLQFSVNQVVPEMKFLNRFYSDYSNKVSSVLTLCFPVSQLQNRMSGMNQFTAGAQHVNMGVRQGVQQPQIPTQVS